MAKNKKIDLEKLDFESALLRLEAIVEKLGNQKIPLEEMVELYNEGNLLREFCQKKLADAKMKVEIILKNE